MQVAFYSAGEITQVKESIPWVRCASGNVYSIFYQKPFVIIFAEIKHNRITMNIGKDKCFSKVLANINVSKYLPFKRRQEFWLLTKKTRGMTLFC